MLFQFLQKLVREVVLVALDAKLSVFIVLVDPRIIGRKELHFIVLVNVGRVGGTTICMQFFSVDVFPFKESSIQPLPTGWRPSHIEGENT